MPAGGLSQAEIEALVRAEHGDPFAVLGPHRELSTIWVRALLPGALAVAVVNPKPAKPAKRSKRSKRAKQAKPSDEPLGALAMVHPDGLFAGSFPAASLAKDYRLAVDYPLGHREVIDDPYRFGAAMFDLDRHLLGEGTHIRPWQVFGAHVVEHEGAVGVRFALWAPTASRAAVIGDFNHWDPRRHAMRFHPGVGIWELFVPGVQLGAIYKYAIRDQHLRALPDKADPYAFAAELRPATASVIASAPKPIPRSPARARANAHDAPISIYEVHLGSWRRAADGGFLDWAALTAQLPAYAAELGFTHIELLPIAEHPFDGSWGYQVTGMFAPTRRFGAPAGFAAFVAACHARGLGVIVDWVPAHFPNDEHALAHFDGTALYEYADPREGHHKDWDTLIFNFGRTEVRNFLIGSALYWLECWGVDGLRVDAVASMLYRDYSRAPDEWIPNVEGGRENLEAVALIRRMNEIVSGEAPGAITVAEESTTWPAVSRPSSSGGLGFDYKWNLGWMHDSLAYLAHPPIHRKFHHDKLTFGLVYAFTENFVLPLSHDEVVHGKRSLIGKMPGDRWQQFANLRAYFGFMWTHPGKKLLFMGGEFAQLREWNHDRGLDWELLATPEHGGMQALIRDLNALYRGQPALHELDCEAEGFERIEPDDRDHSVLVFLRKAKDGAAVLVVCNFTPVPRMGYRVGVSGEHDWREVLNTDSSQYGGSDYPTDPIQRASEPIPAHGRPRSVALTLPPLATIVFTPCR